MSASPLAQKLRLKEGHRVAVVHAPPGCRERLDPLPDTVSVSDTLNGAFDLLWYFVTRKADLERDLARLRESITPAGLLWLSYPKGTSGVPTDLNRDSMREIVERSGLKAVALVAVDDVWSAMRFKVVG